MLISKFNGAKDNAPKLTEVSFTELGAMLASPKACPCTLATCGTGEHQLDGAKPGTCRHKYGAAWSPAAWPQGEKRSKHTVGTVGALVIDYDHLDDTRVRAALTKLVTAGLRFIVHSSHSDGLRGERALRVVIELSEPVTGADWPRFWQSAIDELAPDADPAPKDASRLYFLPSARADTAYTFDTHAGAPLNVAAVLARAPKPAEPVAPSTVEGSAGPASSALLERARARLKACGPAIEGKGGDQHTFSVCAALLHDYALSDAEAWPLLVEWNLTCVPPWDLDELQTKMANARAYADGAYGAGRVEFEATETIREMFGIEDTGPGIVAPNGAIADPHEVPSEDILSAAADKFNVLAGLGKATAVEPAGKPGEWAYEYARARNDVASALGTNTSNPHDRPLFESAAGLFAPGRAWPKTPWLVRGLMAEGGVVGIIGEPKSTKSWLALDIALAVSSGQKAFDAFEVPEAKHAAYFFAEDLALSVRNRIRAFAAGRNVDPATLARNLHIQPRGQHLDVTRDEDVARIIASCRMIGQLGLLVLDPLRDVHTGKENESDDMSKVFASLRLISSVLGCTVLVPHHAKKPAKDQAGQRAGNDIRGSSAIYGALDAIITLRDLIEEQTDKRSVFANTVKAEVKGAKSAGTFAISLTITDDEDGAAIHAAWKVQRPDEAKAAAAIDEDGDGVEDTAISLLDYMWTVEARKAPAQDTRALRAGMKIGKTPLRAAIAFATAKLWIQKNDGTGGRYEITARGREVVRTGRRPKDPPTSETPTLDAVLDAE